MAACVGINLTLPSGNTARTSRARIASFTFSRILGRRGGNPLGIIGKSDQKQAQSSCHDGSRFGLLGWASRWGAKTRVARDGNIPRQNSIGGDWVLLGVYCLVAGKAKWKFRLRQACVLAGHGADAKGAHMERID